MRRRNPRPLAVALVALLAATACGGSESDVESATSGDAVEDSGMGSEPAESVADAVVERVIDGDSVELRVDGDVVESRLIGINAAELADCQGPGARDALEGIALEQAVAVTSFGDDRFGRLLVDLSIAGDSVNFAMVRTGWALALHTDDHGSSTAWIRAMTEAAEGGLGMWRSEDACPRVGGLEISGIEPDPPGPDDDVLEDEWIELTNTSGVTVDLTGWSVRDESSSNRYTFGSGSLEPGETIRLRTGCGSGGSGRSTDVYWCSRNGVWSNQGDTALLLGPTGAIEDWLVLS